MIIQAHQNNKYWHSPVVQGRTLLLTLIQYSSLLHPSCQYLKFRTKRWAESDGFDCTLLLSLQEALHIFPKMTAAPLESGAVKVHLSGEGYNRKTLNRVKRSFHKQQVRNSMAHASHFLHLMHFKGCGNRQIGRWQEDRFHQVFGVIRHQYVSHIWEIKEI